MLSGFSLKTERLDPTPISFSCAESCGHPNLCGYGKAVLEEVLSRDIRCLLLVDCCDVCRRIYDILLNRGGMKFLYLLPLPHKNGSGEITRTERELRRLSDALCQMTGREFDLPLALDAWRRACQAEVLSTPHILLTGAHGGSSLLRTVQARSNLPIVDETCTGNRGLLQPPDLPDRDMFFRTYAQALLCQEKPCMRMQFREEGQNPNAVGVICHTMKFCDYYGFRYAAMKKKWKVPTLKIETDATPQSSGQLHTRLDAFFETIQPRKKVEVAKGVVNYVAGVDSGSASTDAVILDGMTPKEGKKHSARIVMEHKWEFIKGLIKTGLVMLLIMTVSWLLFSRIPELLLGNMGEGLPKHYRADVVNVFKEGRALSEEQLRVCMYRIVASFSVMAEKYLMSVVMLLCGAYFMLRLNRWYLVFTGREQTLWPERPKKARYRWKVILILLVFLLFAIVSFFSGMLFEDLFYREDAVRIVAHSSGSAAFLFPEGVTSPRRGFPPSMQNDSIIGFLFC